MVVELLVLRVVVMVLVIVVDNNDDDDGHDDDDDDVGDDVILITSDLLANCELDMPIRCNYMVSSKGNRDINYYQGC